MAFYDMRRNMNKLTKSELIQRIRDIMDDPNRVVAQPFIDGHQVMYLIRSTEIIPDPAPEVDAELEEAKNRFPVGSWFNVSAETGSTIRQVKEVFRCLLHVYVKSDSIENFLLERCTPATLPITAQWRCMKTDTENSLEHRLLCLDGEYCTGWYDIAKATWCVNNQYTDLSCYETFEWLEIPRRE